ncbi:MAG TPA: PDZ domain-containing protein [Blastocatellia bacterium]|nr:PDZ domain-containing protein [Blastocatellia bacterium]
MSRSVASSLIVLLTALGVHAQQQPQMPVVQGGNPSVVSVVHTLDLQKMVARMREQQNVRVGVTPSAPAYVYNIATGLVVDNAGHVVTRLTNLDLQDKDPKISVTTAAGANLPARLIGVDCATGFAVLEVAGLGAGSQAIVAPASVKNGMAVNIVSSDVLQRAASPDGNLLLWPTLKLAQGNIWASNSPYSKARGALTLLSDSFMSRSDSSVVQTLDNRVIGIAQWAGFGRAYLFPVEFIRDTIARRVIERKDNVPAGWLGATGVSAAQLSENEMRALGMERKTGVVVREVLPESPAAASGISPNDVIVGVDGWDVVGVPDLKAMLSGSPAGQKITLTAVRNRQALSVSVVLGARPDSNLTISGWPIDQSSDPVLSQREEVEKRLAQLQAEYKARLKNEHSRERDEALKELDIEMRQLMDVERALMASAAEAAKKQPGFPYDPSLFNSEGAIVKPQIEDVSFKAGFKARELTSQLAVARFGTFGGILISSVIKDSAADRAGIRAGDVIVSSEDRMIMSIKRLRDLLSVQRGEISLKVMRSGQPTVITLTDQ